MWYSRPSCSYTRLTPPITSALRRSRPRARHDPAQPAVEEPVADAERSVLLGQVSHLFEAVEKRLRRVFGAPQRLREVAPAARAVAGDLLEQGALVGVES